MTDSQIFLRLTLSVILGGFIGLERQIHRRSAGLRTHILVSLGSCLIMLTSLYIFDIYKNQAPLDPARIAAGVITGVGFLGAGAIIRARWPARSSKCVLFPGTNKSLDPPTCGSGLFICSRDEKPAPTEPGERRGVPGLYPEAPEGRHTQ